MPELRRDLVNQHWVAVASGQALKPCDFPIARKKITISSPPADCPFCVGNEAMTPEAVTVIPDENSWRFRVVPNKFTAFSLRENLKTSQRGLYPVMSSWGAHEVVIETPQHGLELQDYSLEHVEAYLQLLCRRYRELVRDERIRYIQIYKNRGMLAGATMEHSHSQILGFPVVPAVNAGGVAYYEEKGRCLICDLLNQDLEQGSRIVYAGQHFVALCPFAAGYPYGAWLVCRRHIRHITELSALELAEMALLLKVYTGSMLQAVNDCSYNIILHNAPVNCDAPDAYHCYVEVNPRLSIASAVEVASGIYMNPVAPEAAAAVLKARFTIDYARELKRRE
jgi:UDPglucose--hexose-1-phosphate uridylyltransferase